MKRRNIVKRRDFLATIAAGTAALAAPAVRAASSTTVLKYVPQADLALLDPCFTPALVTRNHAYLVYDTLYGVDEDARPQPQMALGHVIENGGLHKFARLRARLPPAAAIR